MTDEGSRLLEHALHAAREVTSTTADVERLRRRLDATFASGSVPATATTGQPAAAALLNKTSLWLVTAVTGLGGAAFLLWPHPPAARSVVLPPPVVTNSLVVTEQPVPSAHPMAPDHPVHADSAPPQTRVPQALPRVAKHERIRTGASRMATQVEQTLSKPTDPAAEVELITRAQALVRTQPVQALALLLEHEQRFAHGILVQERETLRIDAERASGHSAQAREHARAFIAAFPASPQTPGLKQWLAAQESDATHHNPAGAPVLTP